MTDPQALSIHLDATVTECGDVVSGLVRWSPDLQPRRVVLTLAFRTSGSATVPDTGGPKPLAIDVSSEMAQAGQARFETAVPVAGPITFSGATITVAWHLEVSLDIAGAGDPAVSEPVTVLPGGGLAVWARQSADPPDSGSGSRDVP